MGSLARLVAIVDEIVARGGELRLHWVRVRVVGDEPG